MRDKEVAIQNFDELKDIFLSKMKNEPKNIVKDFMAFRHLIFTQFMSLLKKVNFVEILASFPV